MRTAALRLAVVGALGIAAAARASADGEAGWRDPSAVEVPMRDEKTLAASLWLPKEGTRWPAIVVQTPYGKEHVRPSQVLDEAAYAIVAVDWRGFHGSAAAARAGAARRRGEDGFDVVEWVAKQPWCTGQVGTWGPSALGVQQLRTAEQRPPHLACAVPIVAASAWRYETFRPGGVLRQEYADALDRLGFGTSELIASHPLDDAAWKFAAAASRPDRIEVPMLLVTGWFDLHPDHVLEDFATLRASGGEAARAQHRAIVGPWTHHVVGSYAVDRGAAESPESVRWMRAEVARWFARWLRGVESPAGAPVTYWVLGEDAWKTTTSWPPAGGAGKAMYLGLRNTLLPTEPPPPGGFDAFAHDPAKPVPTVGGANLDPKVASGSQDLRGAVVGRPDVLTYRSEPLAAPLSIAGHVVANLRVSCDAADARLHVRLCDEHPDGRVMLLADGARAISMRGRLASAEPVEPGTEVDVPVVLPDLAATWAAGHRVVVVVSGSNAPRFEVQPFSATVRVARGGEHGSRILLPLAP